MPPFAGLIFLYLSAAVAWSPFPFPQYAVPATSNTFATNLQNYINCEINVLRREAGNVSLDPFSLNIRRTFFDWGVVIGNAWVRNLTLGGLTNLIVDSATLNPRLFPMGADVRALLYFPNIALNSAYGSNVTVFGRNYNIDGNTNGQLRNLSVNLALSVNSIDLGRYRVSRLSVAPHLDFSRFAFNGFNLGSSNLNGILSQFANLIASIVNNLSGNINDIISPAIAQKINDQLSSGNSNSRCRLTLF